MKSIQEIEPGNYYLFESLSSANSSFFETEQEIGIFKSLLHRYLNKFLYIHRVYVDRNGYQILVRIKQWRTIKANYKKRCERNNKRENLALLQKPWKIVSEMMRIFKSVYVKAVNRLRGREGVLVKHNFKKYYFENVAEYESYVMQMENGERIKSQRLTKYSKGFKWLKGIKWMSFRAKKWSEMYVFKGFEDLVGLKLVNSTYTHHNPPLSSS